MYSWYKNDCHKAKCFLNVNVCPDISVTMEKFYMIQITDVIQMFIAIMTQ